MTPPPRATKLALNKTPSLTSFVIILFHIFSQLIGKKSAEKLKKEYPELITLEMVHMLSATGTKMLLKGDVRARLVIQSLAEIIGKLEKELKGYTTMEHELNKSFNDTTGVKEASASSLKKFFQARVPCQCLHPPKNQTKMEAFGKCCFDDCGERKALSRLSTCAGCRSVFYCCAECQRFDWPMHSQDCQRLGRERKAKLAAEAKQKEQTIVEVEEGCVQEQSDEDDGSEEGSLSTDDLMFEDDVKTQQSDSSGSLGLDELMASLEEWMGQSDANLFPTSDQYKKKKSKEKKKKSSTVPKMNASTSLIPSVTEMENERKKVKKFKSKSSSNKKSSSDSSSKMSFSASFSNLGWDMKKRKHVV